MFNDNEMKLELREGNLDLGTVIYYVSNSTFSKIAFLTCQIIPLKTYF